MYVQQSHRKNYHLIKVIIVLAVVVVALVVTAVIVIKNH